MTRLAYAYLLLLGWHLMLLLLHGTHGHLIGVDKYAEQLVQRIADGIERGDVTGNLMRIIDMEKELRLVEYGLDVSGRAKFESGFVKSIQSVSSYGESGRIQSDKNLIKLWLQLHGVCVVYDVHYNLEAYTGHGTIEFHLPVLVFAVEVNRTVDSTRPTVAAHFVAYANERDIRTRYHPDIGYTQLWARELRKNATLRSAMTDSFAAWSTSWQPMLTAASDEVPYPSAAYGQQQEDNSI